MAKIPTLQSIADACGVSHVTVSRALRGEPNVSHETAERIRAMAAQVGYKVNKVARLLAEGRAGNFSPGGARSIIVPYNRELGAEDLERTFWTAVEGITEAAARSDHHVELLGVDTSDEELHRIRRAIEEERALGVIEMGLQSATIDYLVASGIPMVSSSYRVGHRDDRRKAIVSCDHVEGYTLAWRHLLERGHLRFGYVGLASPMKGSIAHRQECLAASHFLSPVPDPGPVASIENIHSPESIWQALVRAFGPRRNNEWPTAVFCVNDQVANRLVAVLRERGVKVPQELSVVGFGDFPSASFSSPGITTIRIPRKEISMVMFWALADIIAGKPGSRYINQILPMSLVERESVADLR